MTPTWPTPDLTRPYIRKARLDRPPYPWRTYPWRVHYPGPTKYDLVVLAYPDLETALLAAGRPR